MGGRLTVGIPYTVLGASSAAHDVQAIAPTVATVSCTGEFTSNDSDNVSTDARPSIPNTPHELKSQITVMHPAAELSNILIVHFKFCMKIQYIISMLNKRLSKIEKENLGRVS